MAKTAHGELLFLYKQFLDNCFKCSSAVYCVTLVILKLGHAAVITSHRPVCVPNIIIVTPV